MAVRGAIKLGPVDANVVGKVVVVGAVVIVRQSPIGGWRIAVGGMRRRRGIICIHCWPMCCRLFEKFFFWEEPPGTASAVCRYE
jgi:hypothetical protein